MFERDKIARALEEHPFEVGGILGNSHIQTVSGVFIPYFKAEGWKVDRKLIDLADGSKIAADFSIQDNPKDHPTVVIVPGLVASSHATYSLGIGHKAFHYGFNVVRMNLRNQGGTEHLSKSLYHGGQSEDVITLINTLVDQGLDNIYLTGVSLGGNICLKAVGELGEEAKKHIKTLGVLSPVADPLVSWQPMEKRENLLYQANIVHGLKDLIRKKAVIEPGVWDTSLLKGIKTMQQLDEAYQVPFYGFKTCDDYYRNESSMPWVPKITIPTLVIHAEDDTFVPVEPLKRPEFSNNPNIVTLITPKGGHSGFISSRKRYGDLDLHWDQNRVIDFFRLLQ